MRIRSTQNLFRTSALALAVAATAGVQAPAIAQEAAAGGGLEEVVVTAQRREESLQETPISISAFTADTLVQIGAFDINDIGRFAPNVSIQKQPSSNSNAGVFIRGFGQGETSLLADPKVGFYVDGVYIAKTVGGVFDITDLERIEVLRGPQGTLFGRNSTGGALNITSAKPSGELKAKVYGSVGRFGYSRYGASVDTPAVGNFAAKFSYNKMDTDGWADNNYVGPAQFPATKVSKDLASEDNEAYRIALRFTPTEALTFDYAYDRTNNEGVPTPFQIVNVHDHLYDGIHPATKTPNSVPFTFLGGALYQQMAALVGNPNKRRDEWDLDAVTPEWLDVKGHTFTAQWDVAEQFTLKYIYGNRKMDSGYQSTDLDGGAYTARDLFYSGELPSIFTGTPVPRGPIPIQAFAAAIREGKVDTESHELQFIGSAFDEKLQYTGGVFYFEEETVQDNPQTFALPLAFLLANPASAPLIPLYTAFGYSCPGLPVGAAFCGTQRLPIPGANDPGLAGLTDFRYGQDVESWAAYGQATYALTEQLSLTLGLRYTEDKKEGFLYNQNLNLVGQSADNCVITTQIKCHDKWSNTSYLANLAYQINDDLMMFLKYTTGYNAGGFNARASTVSSFSSPYNKEEVKSWELGFKSEWFDNHVRANISFFSNDYTDAQTAQFEAGSGGASSKIVNAGKGKYKGFDMDVEALVTEALKVTASYGYLDAKYDEYIVLDPTTNSFVNIADNTTVGGAPKNTAAIGVQYDFPAMSWGQVVARFDATYKDKIVFHVFNNEYDSAKAYWLLNARLSLVDMNLGNCCGDDHKIRVDLWGKNLEDKEYRMWGIDFGALGYSGNTWGEPRSYGIDFTYTFR